MTYIFLQIVGTTTRERIPDVPMFSASPAKRPRRESLAETISAVGRAIRDFKIAVYRKRLT